MKKLVCVLLIICMVSICFTSCNDEYSKAMELIEEGNYSEAYEILQSLGDYKDAKDMLERFQYVRVSVVVSKEGNVQKSVKITYNENNLPSQAVYSYSDGSSYTVEFTYDIRGNITCVIDGDGDKQEYTYDENGNLIKDSFMLPNEKKALKEYTYDTNGNKTKEIYLEDDIQVSSTEYTYDSNGNMIKRIKETDTENGRKDISIAEYTYDVNGNMIKEIVSNGDGYVLSIEENTYDVNGNVILHSYSSKGVTVYLTESVYDSNGNRIKQVLTHKDGRVQTTESIFDENGKPIKRIHTSPNGGIATDDYIYDSYGNIIKQIHTGNGVETITETEYKLVYVQYDIPEHTQKLIDLI